MICKKYRTDNKPCCRIFLGQQTINQQVTYDITFITQILVYLSYLGI